MKTIFWKEIKEFFNSFSGYIVILFFITSLGGILWLNPSTNCLNTGYASLQAMFDYTPYLFIIICPALTMGIWAKEHNSGMIEILMTSPLNIISLILGKYLSNIFIIVFSLFLTVIYYISLYCLGNPVGNIDSAAVIGSYFGLWLLASSFLSIGTLGATFSQNQLISFVINVFLCFSYYSLFEILANILSLNKASLVFSKLGAASHYYSLGIGIIDSRDVLYFILTIIVMLYLTKFMIDNKR